MLSPRCRLRRCRRQVRFFADGDAIFLLAKSYDFTPSDLFHRRASHDARRRRCHADSLSRVADLFDTPILFAASPKSRFSPLLFRVYA